MSKNGRINGSSALDDVTEMLMIKNVNGKKYVSYEFISYLVGVALHHKSIDSVRKVDRKWINVSEEMVRLMDGFLRSAIPAALWGAITAHVTTFDGYANRNNVGKPHLAVAKYLTLNNRVTATSTYSDLFRELTRLRRNVTISVKNGANPAVKVDLTREHFSHYLTSTLRKLIETELDGYNAVGVQAISNQLNVEPGGQDRREANVRKLLKNMIGYLLDSIVMTRATPRDPMDLSKNLLQAVNANLNQLHKRTSAFGNNNMATNDTVKAMLREVYGKWNDLDESVRHLYKEFLSIQIYNETTKQMETITDSNKYLELVNANLNPNNVRVNFLKSFVVTDTLFGFSLPTWPQAAAGFIANNVNTNRSEMMVINDATARRTFFIELYRHAMEAGPVTQPHIDFDIGRVQFRVALPATNVLGFDIKSIFDRLTKNEASPATRREVEIIPPAVPCEWIRDSHNKLVRIKEDGTHETVDQYNNRMIDEYRRSPNGDAGTLGTLLKYDDWDKANEMITECLVKDSPGDVTKCIESISQANLNDLYKIKPGTLNPQVIEILLEKLQFKTYTTSDGKKCIQSLESYLYDVRTKFSKQEVSVMNNSTFLKYIGGLIKYMNANNGILSDNKPSIGFGDEMSPLKKFVDNTARNPVTRSQSQLSYLLHSAISPENTSVSPLMSQNSYLRMTRPMAWTGVPGRQMPMFPIGNFNINGGVGREETRNSEVQALRNIFTSLTLIASDRRRPMKHENIAKINSWFDTLTKMEEKVNKLCTGLVRDYDVVHKFMVNDKNMVPILKPMSESYKEYTKNYKEYKYNYIKTLSVLVTLVDKLSADENTGFYNMGMRGVRVMG